MPSVLKPDSEIITRLKLNPDGYIQREFTKRCREYMDPFVPYDEGTLSTIVDVGSSFIIYEMPYARYQYYGERSDGTHKINEANRNRSMHPLASSYWDKKMVSAKMKDLEKEMQELVGGRR